jgi:hypothetical protein
VSLQSLLPCLEAGFGKGATGGFKMGSGSGSSSGSATFKSSARTRFQKFALSLLMECANGVFGPIFNNSPELNLLGAPEVFLTRYPCVSSINYAGAYFPLCHMSYLRNSINSWRKSNYNEFL